MDTGNFSYLCPDLFGIFRNSHRLQCTHCARCDFQNLLKNIRLYDPENLRNALLISGVRSKHSARTFVIIFERELV